MLNSLMCVLFLSRMADNRRTTSAGSLPRHASHLQDLLMALQAGAAALEALNRPAQAQTLRALPGGLMSVLNSLKKFASAIEEGPPPKRPWPSGAAPPRPPTVTPAVVAARDATKAERERLTAATNSAAVDAASLALSKAEMLSQE